MKRTEKVNLRITPSERSILEAIAQERSTSLGSVVRWAIKKAVNEADGNVLPDGKGESVRQVWTPSTHAL